MYRYIVLFTKSRLGERWVMAPCSFGCSMNFWRISSIFILFSDFKLKLLVYAEYLFTPYDVLCEGRLALFGILFLLYNY